MELIFRNSFHCERGSGFFCRWRLWPGVDVASLTLFCTRRLWPGVDVALFALCLHEATMALCGRRSSAARVGFPDLSLDFGMQLRIVRLRCE